MMQGSRFSSKSTATAFLIATALALPLGARGQGSASSVLGQLATAFSAGQVVQQVLISGNATWNAGQSQDSGTVTLTASTDGSSQMTLLLASAGQRTEAQTGSGESADCQWAGADGVANEIDPGNCLRPALWFLPALSLQPSLLPSYLEVADLGAGTVGSGTTIYRHLQGQIILADLSSTLPNNDLAQQSASDIGLDATSLLPAVLAYSVLPDSGAPTPIAIEIHYSNYQVVNGIQIPFLIQRYVNGSLQLEIAVGSAQAS